MGRPKDSKKRKQMHVRSLQVDGMKGKMCKREVAEKVNEKYLAELAGESDVDEDEDEEKVEEEDDDEEDKDETDVREMLERLKVAVVRNIPQFETMTSQCGSDGDLWISEALLLLQQRLHPDVSVQSLFIHYFRQYLEERGILQPSTFTHQPTVNDLKYVEGAEQQFRGIYTGDSKSSLQRQHQKERDLQELFK